jgi:hypothetical protein
VVSVLGVAVVSVLGAAVVAVVAELVATVVVVVLLHPAATGRTINATTIDATTGTSQSFLFIQYLASRHVLPCPWGETFPRTLVIITTGRQRK